MGPDLGSSLFASSATLFRINTQPPKMYFFKLVQIDFSSVDLPFCIPAYNGLNNPYFKGIFCSYNVVEKWQLERVHISTLSLLFTTIVPYANSLDLDETACNSLSYPDPICLTLRQHFHHIQCLF